MRHTQPACELPDSGCLARCFRPQAVIDGNGKQFWRALELLRPTGGENKKRGRVRTAGNRKQEARQIFKSAE
jgi:hypothetical protein